MSFIQAFQPNRYQSIKTLLATVLLSAALPAASADNDAPRNVILFIGDGMDDHQITIARNYLKGASGRLTMDNLSQRSSVQVLTVDEHNPQQAVYVADSANSATAMATGQVTSRGRIATSAKTDKDLPTIVEIAEIAGLRTGIVSTASITDATPASFIAHVNDRGCEGPKGMVNGQTFGGYVSNCESDLKANGGKGSIAEQLADSDVEVYLGGGSKFFDQPLPDSKDTVLSLAQSNGYHILRQPADLNSINGAKKILGLFSPSTMPVRLQGEQDQQAQLLVIDEQHQAQQPDAFSCTPNPAFEQVPSLRAMTETAINHLSHDNQKGFFLMVESASIDKQSHLRRPCGSIGELEQLDESVAVALAFAKRSPNTLVLITADHGQAAQLIPYPSLFNGLPKAHTSGHLAVLKTPEGSLLGVNYATNHTFIEEHTGTQVPLLMNLQTDYKTNGMVTQPQLFTLMRNYLEI